MSERRLQAIYDALDVGNYKQVLKLCDVALKKGDGQIVEALKAMALLRTGKVVEARALALESRRGISAPIDDGLVHALSLFYRACGDLLSVWEVCDEAFKCEPNNEVAGTQLFYAAVRLFDFPRQQAVAMRLQRQFPKRQREFVMWTLVSLLLQARPGGTAEAALAPKLVQLATMMLEKAGGPTTVAELRLALAIAQAHGEVRRAAAEAAAQNSAPAAEQAATQAAAREADAESAQRVLALLGAHADLLATIGAESAELEASSRARAGDLAGALDSREAALLAAAEENWEHLCRYMDALLPTPHELRGRAGAAEALGSANRPPPPRAPLVEGAAEVAAAIGRVEAVLAQLQLKHPRSRAPLLGRVALCWKRLALAPADDAAALEAARDLLCSALVLYFEAYSDRPCCFEDGRPYVALLVGQERHAQRLCEGMEACCAEAAAALPAGEGSAEERRGALQRRINAAQWRAVLGHASRLSAAERCAQATKLAVEYGEALALGDACAKTELQPADGLLLCASSLAQGDVCPLQHLAFLLAAPAQAAAHSGRMGANGGEMWRAAAQETRCALCVALALEEALVHSPANFQMRLRLIAAYSQLGAAEAVRAHFTGLGTRRLQLESLQYAVLPQLFALGNAREASSLCAQARAFYSEAGREVSDSAVLPYKHGNWVQALDFCDFRARLERSHWRVHVGVTAALLALSAAPTDVAAAAEALGALKLAPRVTSSGGVGAYVAGLTLNLDTAVFESYATHRQDSQLLAAAQHWLGAHVAFALALESSLASLLPVAAAAPPAPTAANGNQSRGQTAEGGGACADRAAAAVASADAGPGGQAAASEYVAQLEAAAASAGAGGGARQGDGEAAFPPSMVYCTVGAAAMRAALAVSKLALARAPGAVGTAGAASNGGEAHAGAELLAQLQHLLGLWAAAAERACVRARAPLSALPPHGLSWPALSQLAGEGEVEERLEASHLDAEAAGFPPPLDAHAISACAELALVQLPASCLLLHAAAAALARAMPKPSKKGAAVAADGAVDEAAQLGASCRAAMREAAARVGESAADLARSLAPLATGGPSIEASSEQGEAGQAQEPLGLKVLPHADYILEGTPRAPGAHAARTAMAARLRTSYADSASQLQKRLQELSTALRQVR